MTWLEQSEWTTFRSYCDFGHKHTHSHFSLCLCFFVRLQSVCKMASQNQCYHGELMGFFYNNSNQTKDDWHSTQLILVQCVGSIFCCFILVSNAMVIAAVITNKRFHYPFYYLLANLAASDFLAGIAYVYLMFNTGEVSRKLTVQGYFIRQGLLDTSLSASLANLLVIALERYISVMNWKVHSNLTKRRVTLLIVSVWAISIFMGTVPSLGWNCICSLEKCSTLAPIFSRSYLIFWSVSNLVVFLVMVVMYLRIYTYVTRKTSVLSPHTSGSINRKRTPIKLIKTVMTVLGKFSNLLFSDAACDVNQNWVQM